MSPGGSIPVDEEPFRLRRFVRLLDQHGELETVDAPVDYAEHAAAGRPLPIAFVIGSHPADGVAAVGTWPAADEVALMGALRGALVEAVGSRDGRDVLRALDDLRRAGRAERLADGRYALGGGR